MTEPSLVIASLRVLGALLFAGSVPSFCLGQIVIDTQVGTWLFSAAFVLGIVLALVKIYDVVRRRPPIDAEFATKKEVTALRSDSIQATDKLYNAVESLRLEVKKDVKDLDVASEKRAGKIHSRIDTLAEKFSGQVAAVTARVDSLPCAQTRSCPS